MRTKNKRIVISGAILGLVIILVVIMVTRKKTVSPIGQTEKILKPNNIAQETIGASATYLHLEIPGELADHAHEVISALDSFRKRHPELRITNYWIDYTHQTHPGLGAHIYGIWINHEPCGCVIAPQ